MDGILSSRWLGVNETAVQPVDHATIAGMTVEQVPEASQFRVTLFVGPQPVEGKPFTFTCVFNVKKRSWKGGVQVAVDMAQRQIDSLSTEVHFPRWLAEALKHLPNEDRPSHQERAHELFIQAICWCKLDLLLQAGITQENQCLADDTWMAEVAATVIRRKGFITSYIASEMDLTARDVTAL